MRIAYMLSSLGIGGAERQAIAIAERMAARGHTATLIVLGPRQAGEWPTSIRVVHLGLRKTPGSISMGLLHARQLLSGFRPDLVHSHTYPANIAARTLRLLGAAPVVLSTVHNIYEGHRSCTLAYRLTDFLSRHTTAVSEAVARHQIRKHAVPERKCSVLCNGIDLQEFVPNPRRRKEVRSAMNATKDFVWLATGRITQAKDYSNLLRAFARLMEPEPRAVLWIAADTSNEDFKTLCEMAGRLGLLQRVRWLGLRHDIPDLLAAADAFVLSSAWEGMPLAIGEAMAMEKPVVATDVGGVRELVGETGTLVSAKNPDALAAAMLAVMRAPLGTQEARGRTARQRICGQFSMDAKADEWEQLYKWLLTRSS